MALFFANDSCPICSIIVLAVPVTYVLFTQLFNKQGKEGKLRLLIALFSPLIGVLSQSNLTNLCSAACATLPIQDIPMYLTNTAVLLLQRLYFECYKRILDSLQSIAVLGIIHGASEVIERSTMVVIDHICHVVCKRTSAPWGSFRTARRERLMADIAIMSMLYESTAIVSVNGFLYLYQFIYLKDDSF